MTTMDRISEAEYLVRERAADYRSEYVAGRVYFMAGASRPHNVIALNVAGLLHGQLRGRPCEAYAADMRVKIRATGLYTYPDVVVVCGRPDLEDANCDTVLNPVVIMEVISPSTEAYDRGEKFAHYRRLDSVVEYVLIAQDRMRVEHFSREGERWSFVELAEPASVLELGSIGCALRLGDIYERLELLPFSELPLRV